MDQQLGSAPAAADVTREYRIDAIEKDETRVRKPRQWIKFTLRRLDDGRIFQVKLRHTGNVGDTIQLDDRVMQVRLWKP